MTRHLATLRARVGVVLTTQIDYILARPKGPRRCFIVVEPRELFDSLRLRMIAFPQFSNIVDDIYLTHCKPRVLNPQGNGVYDPLNCRLFFES